MEFVLFTIGLGYLQTGSNLLQWDLSEAAMAVLSAGLLLVAGLFRRGVGRASVDRARRLWARAAG